MSPFIKFKNASKETVDASDELVEEIRRALIQAGQKLSKHIRREEKEADVEKKLRHIEQFAPILIDGACRITGSDKGRREKALEGLAKLLGREAQLAEKELNEAIAHSELAIEKLEKTMGHSIADLSAIPTIEKPRKEEDTDEQLTLDGISESKGKRLKK